MTQPPTVPTLPRHQQGGKCLYLDFDGVLHTHDVFVNRQGQMSIASGHQYFEHADMLGELIQPYPDLRIILSTTWSWVFGLDGARAHLPPSLRHRCEDLTFNSALSKTMSKNDFADLPRGRQVAFDVTSRRPEAFLALDDDRTGWGELLPYLVPTEKVKGISSPHVRRTIEAKLAIHFGP
jgi:hypothetical protein